MGKSKADDHIFDTADELFHNVLFPDCFYEPETGVLEMRIGVWNESYIAIYGFRPIHGYGQLFEIWVMDEVGGAKCSWINYVTTKITLVIYPPAVQCYSTYRRWTHSLLQP